MKTDEYFKKFLLEAELKENEIVSASRIVAHLHSDPEIMGFQNPPPGYEEHLLASLRRQLPEEKKVRTPSSSQPAWKSWWLGTTVALAGIFAFMLSVNSGFFSQKSDSTIAEKGVVELVGADSESVQQWLVTVADSGFRFENSNQDIHGIALQVSKDKNLLRKLNRVIAQWSRN